MLAKLDCYDYELFNGLVRISLDKTNDPIAVDILSEIERSNGRIYVEGRYFLMAGYDMYMDEDSNVYLDLVVTKTE